MEPQFAPERAHISAISRCDSMPMILYTARSWHTEERQRGTLADDRSLRWIQTTVPPPASQIMKVWLGRSLCSSVRYAQCTAAASGSL